MHKATLTGSVLLDVYGVPQVLSEAHLAHHGINHGTGPFSPRELVANAWLVH